MSKDATILLLDVGISMKGAHLTKSKEAAFWLLNAKLISGKKTDQVGVILFGSEETNNQFEEQEGYENIVVMSPISVPNLALLRSIQSLQTGSVHGDCISALIVATDLLLQHCKKLKYTKRIIIITDAASATDTEGMEDVLSQLTLNNIEVNFIVLNGVETEIESINLNAFEKVAESTDGQVLNISDALAILNTFHAKKVKPVTLFRGPMTLGDPEEHGDASIVLPVWAYAQTMEVRMPTAKKYHEAAEQGTHDVHMDRNYHAIEEDGTIGAQVDEEKLIKAYRYGRMFVPFSYIDEESIKLKTMKSINILGFVEKKKVKREWSMSNSYLIVAEPKNASAQVSMSALIHSMYEKQFYALVRYCRIDNAQPKLGFLSPYIQSDYEWFYFNQLPYAEDMRDYPFASLEKNAKLELDEEMLNAVDELIDGMDLMPAEKGDEEYVDLQKVYNPAYQYFYQCIRTRALNPNADLPNVDPRLMVDIQVPNEISVRVKPTFERIQQLFNVYKIVKELPKTKDGLVSQEPPEISIDDIIKQAQSSQMQQEEQVAVEPFFTLNRNDIVNDFKKAVSDAHADLIPEATRQIRQCILGFANEQPELARDCILAYRQLAIDEMDETLPFNEFMYEIKSKAKDSKLWKLMVNESMDSLVTEDESLESEVTLSQAKSFYRE